MHEKTPSRKSLPEALSPTADIDAPLDTSTGILDCLTNAIVDHHLPPGTKLGEEAIADFFKVGRSRVHEALLKLNHDGLVTLLPNRGAFVTVPSVKDGKQICEARRIIEIATARMAARKATPSDIAKLEKLTNSESQAWAAHKSHKAVRLSREFHVQVAQIAGNTILLNTIRNILHRSTLSVAHYVRRGFSGCMCDEHIEIVAAIREGNEDRAADLVKAHLDHIEELLTAAFDEEAVDIREALQRSVSGAKDAS